MKITPELQEAYNKCMYEAYMKKRRCSDKCKICHPDKEEVIEVGEDIKGNRGGATMNYVPKKIILEFDVSDMTLIEAEQAIKCHDISWVYGRNATCHINLEVQL